MSQLQDFQQRVVDEKQELDDKLDKLRVFLRSDRALALDFTDRSLLVMQERAMTDYTSILADRINRFFERG